MTSCASKAVHTAPYGTLTKQPCTPLKPELFGSHSLKRAEHRPCIAIHSGCCKIAAAAAALLTHHQASHDTAPSTSFPLYWLLYTCSSSCGHVSIRYTSHDKTPSRASSTQTFTCPLRPAELMYTSLHKYKKILHDIDV